MKIRLKPLAAAMFLCSAVTTANAALTPVDVHSWYIPSTGGLNTGIVLSAGQFFSIDVAANDLWAAGVLPRWSDANGLTGNLFATGTDDTGMPAGVLVGQNWGTLTQSGFTAPYGMLVGQIGSGPIFSVGTSYAGNASTSGALKLMYWDFDNSDNTGAIRALVDTTSIAPAAVPAPATLLLTTLGLGMIGAIRRNRKQ